MRRTLAVIAAATSLAALAEPAIACWWTNYYGRVQYREKWPDSDQTKSAAAAIYRIPLGVPDSWCGGFSNEEMWITPQNSGSGSSAKWIEVGYTNGWMTDQEHWPEGSSIWRGDAFFWAIQNDDLNYYEHYVGPNTDATGTWRWYLIEWVGGTAWNVWISGTNGSGWTRVATAVGITPWILQINAGLETTSQDENGVIGDWQGRVDNVCYIWGGAGYTSSWWLVDDYWFTLSTYLGEGSPYNAWWLYPNVEDSRNSK